MKCGQQQLRNGDQNLRDRRHRRRRPGQRLDFVEGPN